MHLEFNSGIRRLKIDSLAEYAESGYCMELDGTCAVGKCFFYNSDFFGLFQFLKKLNRQERVVEEVKLSLKPHYTKKHITKEEYKEILRRSVPKVSLIIVVTLHRESTNLLYKAC